MKRNTRATEAIRAALALVVMLSPGAHAAAGEPAVDDGSTLIVGAQLVDGTGAPSRRASVRVRDGRVQEVGALMPAAADTIVDGGGLVLAPGFIDTHSHHAGGLDDDPGAVAAVSQGITTIVSGQDGSSSFPLRERFERLTADPPAINVASYSGHGTLRDRVMGDAPRAATIEEVQAMAELLRQDMEAGALGLSTGLEYDPGIHCETEELIVLSREAARFGGRYISHVRSEDRALWEAVEETLEIGRSAGLPVQISHMKLAMRSMWGRADELITRLERARAEGIDVTADVYPYTYWQSTMTVLFPDRDFADREAAAFALRELAPPEGIVLTRFEADPALVGRSIADIARERETDPVTAYLDLIAESRRAEKDGKGDESIIARSMDEDDVWRLLAWPHTNVCSDGSARGGHPRGYGAFPRFLAGRERAGLTLEEAIRKMTSLSARHVGIADRGVIRAGAPADLVLLDPQRVADRATIEEPHRVAEGIEKVWVNGVLVWSEGRATGARPGQVVRRSPAR